MLRQLRTKRQQQRGLSLVELMVGLAVGLLVVAGAAMVTSTQLSDNRRLLLETQLQQDLRAAADIITRELRRTGSWAYGNQVNVTVASSAAAQVNPYIGLVLSGSPVTEVNYSYYRNSAATGPFGFQLSGGVIRSRIDGGATATWQDLTDSRVLTVTSFTITQTDGPAAQLPCPKDCPGGGTACFPTLTVRELAVDIAGQAVGDPSVVRSIRSFVKLRNDLLTPSAAGQVCPS